jgi:uncharacterized Ntn-hydrolase superfamily protein
MLQKGQNANSVLSQLIETENYPEWRQVLVLDGEGESATHSGNETLGIHAARQGQDCVAGGNMLADTGVVDAMISTFEDHANELAERLIDTMEAGLEAGGEMGSVHSIGLQVADRASWPVVDLRVDWHIAPLDELRMLWKNYRPQRDDYIARAIEPAQSPGYGVPGDDR